MLQIAMPIVTSHTEVSDEFWLDSKQLRTKVVQQREGVMIYLIGLVFTVAWLWLIVIAFKSDSTVWGSCHDFVSSRVFRVRNSALERILGSFCYVARRNWTNVHIISRGHRKI